MNGYEAIAAALGGITGWMEDEIAAGEPPRWVAQQGAEGVRHIAWLAGLAGSGKLPDGDVAGMLAEDDGSGDTVMLRSRAAAQPRVRHKRSWRLWHLWRGWL